MHAFKNIPLELPSFSQLAGNQINKLVWSNDALYVGTNFGLSISRDGGRTFSNRTLVNGLLYNAITDISVNGSMVCVISAYHYLNISKDGGNTFKNIAIQNGNGSANRIYCDDEIIITGGYSGLFISTDGGTTFIKTLADRFDSMTYVNSILYLQGWSNILVSTDKGRTFTSKGAANGLKNPIANGGTLNVGTLAATRNGDLYINTNVGLFVTRDKGENFTMVKSYVSPDQSSYLFYVNNLTTSENSVFINMQQASDNTYLGLFKSSDGGTTFTEFANATKGVTARATGPVVIKNNDVYAGTSDGLAISNDQGQSYRMTKNEWGIEYGDQYNYFQYSYGPLSMCAIGNKLFVGTSNGIQISEDQGSTFRKVLLGRDALFPEGAANAVIKLKCTQQKIYALTPVGIRISNDFAATFSDVRVVQGAANYFEEWNVVDGVMYFSYQTGAVLVSSDDGLTFTNRTSPTTFCKKLQYDYEECTLKSIHVKNNAIYVHIEIRTAQTKYYIFKSDVNGSNYTKILVSVNDLELVNGKFIGSSNNGIQISTDDGLTFQKIPSLFSSQYINYNGQHVYVMGNNGLEVSSDGGLTFTKSFENRALPETRGTMAWQYLKDYLFFGSSLIRVGDRAS